MKGNTIVIAGLMVISTAIAQEFPLSFNDILKAYQDHKYQVAAKGFQKLAKLGDEKSQFNLGVMYFNGEGLETDKALATAWFGVAATSGTDQYVQTFEKMLARLNSEEQHHALQLKSSLAEKFGAESLMASIRPESPEDAGRQAVQRQPTELRVIKRVAPRYPEKAARNHTFGSVTVEFEVTPRGEVITPYVIQSIPVKTFDQASLDAVRLWRFQPFAGTRSKHVTQTFNYELNVPNSRLSGKSRRMLTQLSELAKSGDAQAQYAYALLLETFPNHIKSQDQTATDLYYRAAVSGVSNAQFRLVARLQQGDGCKLDLEKADIWLKLAASHNNAAAQYELSRRGTRDELNMTRWLSAAAENGYLPAIRDLAWHLSTSDQAQKRDGARALKLLKGLGKQVKYDPELLEIKAAALASQGHFSAAHDTELDALKRAKSLHRDLKKFHTRATLYTQSQLPAGQSLSDGA